MRAHIKCRRLQYDEIVKIRADISKSFVLSRHRQICTVLCVQLSSVFRIWRPPGHIHINRRYNPNNMEIILIFVVRKCNYKFKHQNIISYQFIKVNFSKTKYNKCAITLFDDIGAVSQTWRYNLFHVINAQRNKGI